MPQFAREFRDSNQRIYVERRLSHCRTETRPAQWLLAPFSVFFGLLSAFAQNATPGCLPYTTNYPCIYVADMGVPNANIGSTVPVLNATTNSLIGSISDPQLMAAFAVAITPNNAFAYVSLQSSIAVIDTSANKVINTITLPSQPSQISFAHDGAFAWVAERGFGYSAPSVQAISTTAPPPGMPPVIHTVTGGTSNLSFYNPAAITLSLDGTTAYAADNCGNYECIDVVDTSKYALTKQIPLPTIPFNNASMAITPDGSLLCISVEVPSQPTSYGVAFIRTSDNSVLPTIGTFSQVPDSNYGLGITLDGTLYVATNGGIVLVNTNTQTFTETLQFGNGPTGIAIAPDGVTVYVTNSSDKTLSVIKGGLLISTIKGVGNSPQGVAVMPSLPPTIVTQPSSQTIGSAQSATLSVTANGTPPLAYQWYQGQSGDTSNPIQGATSSSYTTPAPLPATTSYWVAVSNLVTRALVTSPLVTGASSTTATIMPTLHAPTCTLSLQGTSSLLAVAATAVCIDGQQQTQPLLTTLSWGDGSSTAANNGTLVANKTYSAVQTVNPYMVTVMSTDTSQLTGTMQVALFLSPAMSVFAGQSASVNIRVPPQTLSKDPVTVSFECTSVVDSNGHVSSPSDLDISCSSSPSVVTLDTSQSVTISVNTTGTATSIGLGSRHSNWSYAFLLPVPVFLLAGMRPRSTRTGHTGLHRCLAVFTAAIVLAVISCGGGLRRPRSRKHPLPPEVIK